MKKNEFKKKQASRMRKLQPKGTKAFLAKFKTKKALSEHMKKVRAKRK